MVVVRNNYRQLLRRIWSFLFLILMIQLKTFKNIVLKKENLSRIGDLINIEGPVLSVFQDKKNKDFYLFDWADSDEYFNRWLVYKVNPESIKGFIKNKISYKELFLSSIKSEYYYVDIDNRLSQSNYTLNKISHLPDIYIPLKENKFDKNDAKNIEQIMFMLSDTQNTQSTIKTEQHQV